LNSTSSYPPVTIDDGTILSNLRDTTTSSAPPHNLTVLGWGTTESPYLERISYWLRQVELQYISNTDCNQLYCQKSRYFQDTTPCHANYITRNMICAHAVGRDACGGDSGGPLLWIDDHSPQPPNNVIQIGVVSWGEGCASDLPGVYAKLSRGIKIWIEEYIHAVNNGITTNKDAAENEEEGSFSNTHDKESSTSASSSTVGAMIITTTSIYYVRILLSLSILSYCSIGW